MREAGDLAYLYARLCGSLRNSWLGPRSSELLGARRLPDLWRLLFDETAPALPERLLVSALESRALAEAASGLSTLGGGVAGAEGLVGALVRKSEYAWVKRILLGVRDKEGACPEPPVPGIDRDFDPGAYPRLDLMFRGGRFSWISEASLLELAGTENRLDRQFYAELWDIIRAAPEALASGLRGLFLFEVETENCLWALRLARYYGYAPEHIQPLLVALPGTTVEQKALALLGRRQDRRADWNGWRFESFLSPGGEAWRLDLPGLERHLRGELSRRARLALHLNPETWAPLYGWFLLKEAETALILGCAEALALDAPAEELEAFVTAGRLP